MCIADTFWYTYLMKRSVNISQKTDLEGKKIHFIGICGAGMSAVAKLAQEAGAAVSGSDAGFYPPISTYLEEHAIPCTAGYAASNIPSDVDTIVIGKHATLTPEENPEVAEAFSKYADKITSFPKVLSSLTAGRTNLICVGSYGKSTTSSLMAHILEQSGIDTGYFIGASPITPSSNAHIGTSQHFVLEGDEYPSANFDPTSKFMYLHPDAVLLTSLEHDHINIFKTHDEYKQPFFDLVTQLGGVPSHTLVLCSDDTTIKAELPKLTDLMPARITYGLESGDYQAHNIVYGEVTHFELVQNGEVITKLQTTLLGAHNIQNIVGVAALLLSRGIVTPEQIASGLTSFLGIRRRLDLLTPGKTIPVYEGFGSSYAKARAAINALLLHYPEKKLVILFEPHTFSWRNRGALDWYRDVFREARLVYVYEPPLRGVADTNQLTQVEIVSEIQKHSQAQTVTAITNGATDVPEILAQITAGDVVLILSSGDMGGIIAELPKQIQ
jgi:UDP-N-acetylmuramate: L-alanyl-gamma-D-glutamyl-meso-diaminopimelate ligase